MNEYFVNELGHLCKVKAKISEAFMQVQSPSFCGKSIIFEQAELAVLEKVLMNLIFIQK